MRARRSARGTAEAALVEGGVQLLERDAGIADQRDGGRLGGVELGRR